MQRRVFLRRGLFGGALLVVGTAGGLALWPGDRAATPRRALQSIPPDAFPVLVAVAARVLHGTSADPVEVAHRVDEALQRTTPEARRDLGRVLGLLESALGGLLLRRHPKPFTLLSEAEQDAALLAWRDSSLVLLRGAYHALRKLCLAAHWATPDAWFGAGYGGPAFHKAEPPAAQARAPLYVDERALAPVLETGEAMPE